MLTVAVDWSGRASGDHRAIWTAVVEDGAVVDLASGQSRAAAIDAITALARVEPDLVVGLDFAFSLPRWFADEVGAATAEALWRVVASNGEEWLRGCQPPFWGRPGRRRPPDTVELRRAEVEVAAVGGIRPKSVFQVAGAGAVGTGSLRGMPHLLRLAEAGFAIWPMHDAGPRHPRALEIYPRLLTGPVVKRSLDARRLHLEERWPDLNEATAAVVASTEDAFDAAVSALVMDRHRHELAALPPARDALDRLEGRIWVPGIAAAAVATVRRR